MTKLYHIHIQDILKYFFFFGPTMQHMGSSPNSDQTKAPYRPSCTLHYCYCC